MPISYILFYSLKKGENIYLRKKFIYEKKKKNKVNLWIRGHTRIFLLREGNMIIHPFISGFFFSPSMFHEPSLSIQTDNSIKPHC